MKINEILWFVTFVFNSWLVRYFPIEVKTLKTRFSQSKAFKWWKIWLEQIVHSEYLKSILKFSFLVIENPRLKTSLQSPVVSYDLKYLLHLGIQV